MHAPFSKYDFALWAIHGKIEKWGMHIEWPGSFGHRISRHTKPVSRLSQYSFGMHAPFFQILEIWGMHTEWPGSFGHRISRLTKPVSRLSQYSFGMHAPFFQILEIWGMHTEWP